MSYHINPKTGNPNLCRATVGKCPFGDKWEHFATKENARRAYETKQSTKELLGGVKREKRPSYVAEGPYPQPSTINEALKRLNYLRSEIFTRHAAGANFASLMGLIDERGAIERELDNYPRTEARQEMPRKLITELPHTFLGHEARKGYTNDVLSGDETYEATNRGLQRLSSLWLDRASSADVWAISRYCYDSGAYARETQARGELSQEWKDFESAVEHAPTMEPIVAYSGLNEYVTHELQTQAEAGRVKLERVLSASINPAMVNSFKRGDEGVAFEILTDKAAFASAVSHRPDEMEIFIPKDEYEVVHVLENIPYHWPSNNGTEARKVYQLRPVS